MVRSDSAALGRSRNPGLGGVKNLLTVLSSAGGGLGSTRPAAAEDKVTDNRAEETCSE